MKVRILLPALIKTYYMMNINFGPDWFYKLLLVLAALGAIAGIYGVIKIGIWLFNHLRFV